ncbi:hypothetical protein CAPN001_11340 [Capnocytophaga stomatis]|uniref:hypothetical protein n=1 Tax=Capnocytophaga stomatis TaxID=1848904 RepID=UPI00194E861D|nr:hypothetical protein [Capnocytophaga stomatis]GIJ96565.1 hypothetical protein CAPN001_11340 [Capnocytophaga stomatis]
MVRVCKWLVPKGYRAITLYPFIFVRNEEDKGNAVLINHERIHLKQQAELLVVFFYLWYFIDFMWKYAKYRNWDKAYRNIIFEREAYSNESNLEYLKNRKPFQFLKSKQ